MESEMPNRSQQAWLDFSASTACLEADSAAIHSRYLNQWVGIYKGKVEAAADTFDGVDAILASKNIPTGDTLVRFIGQKEMTLIL
jgi:hypothetical protein